jgi:CheY-like chemotaxis protein
VATILLVDDDPDALTILASILQSGGHQVLGAKGGTDALDVLDRDISIDLLVTDIVMPGLNGFNLARMARTRRRELKVLYLTAFHENAVTMRDAGDKYGKVLSKPIGARELLSEVDAALAAPSGAAAEDRSP